MWRSNKRCDRILLFIPAFPFFPLQILHSPLFMSRFPVFLLFALVMSGLFFGCEEVKDSDVADLPLDLTVTRIDSLMMAFAQAIREEDSIDVWSAYDRFVAPEREWFASYLLLPPGSDSKTLDSLMTRTLGLALKNDGLYTLLDTVENRFPYSMDLAEVISAPLKRLQREFPEVQLPRFTAHVNGYPVEGDWNTVDQVSAFPGIVSLGLHYFMGADWPNYPAGIYAYQRRRMVPEYMETALVSWIAEEFIRPIPLTEQPPLLDYMIRAGIKQEFLNQLLPYTPDSILLGYTSEQMEWAENFEAANFKFLKPLLFETDQKYERDYIMDKAYTSELSLGSAPRIGEHIGWKMVSAYLTRHPEITLAQLCEETDYSMIMREAKYKP